MKRSVPVLFLLFAAATAFGSNDLFSPFAPEFAYNAYGGSIERLDQRLPDFYGGSGQSAAYQVTYGTLSAATVFIGTELGQAGRLGRSVAWTTESRLAAEVGQQTAETAAKSAPVVIRENMLGRVKPYARNVGGYTIDDWLAGRQWSQQLNDQFIVEMKEQGRMFIDIGPDFERRLANRINPAEGRSHSTVYGRERQQLLNYDNYQRVYERSGKYQGGVPGFDF